MDETKLLDLFHKEVESLYHIEIINNSTIKCTDCNHTWSITSSDSTKTDAWECPNCIAWENEMERIYGNM